MGSYLPRCLGRHLLPVSLYGDRDYTVCARIELGRRRLQSRGWEVGGGNAEARDPHLDGRRGQNLGPAKESRRTHTNLEYHDGEPLLTPCCSTFIHMHSSADRAAGCGHSKPCFNIRRPTSRHPLKSSISTVALPVCCPVDAQPVFFSRLRSEPARISTAGELRRDRIMAVKST